MNRPFHLSLPCKDMDETKKFYLESLGLKHGRNNSHWLDVELFDHQLTFVMTDKFQLRNPSYKLDATVLPMFHFGVILETNEWEEMYDKTNSWLLGIEPKQTFFKDQLGEHHSFFITDPNGYTIEFKTFVKNDEVFMF